MKIDNNLGYREIEKIGDILKELGNSGNFRGWSFELDDLEIVYDPSRDWFEFWDGTTDYKIDLGEV